MNQISNHYHVASLERNKLPCCAELQVSHIRKYLTNDATESLANSRVTLDYYYTLLIDVPKTVLNKLQNIQNTGVLLAIKTYRYNHISPILIQLKWLVRGRNLQHAFAESIQTNRALRSKKLVNSLAAQKGRSVT